MEGTQVDYYLKIEGIDGEAKDEKHKGEIEVASFQWGASNKGMQGGGGARVSMQEFRFTTKVNKASPKIFAACAEGKAFNKAVLTCRKGGDGQQNYLIWTLENVRVATFDHIAGGSEDTIVPGEAFTLTFDTIKMEYKAEKKDGTLDGAIAEGWDKPNNKKIK